MLGLVPDLAKQHMRMEVLGLQSQFGDSWGYQVWSILEKLFPVCISMTWTLMYRIYWIRWYEKYNVGLLLDKEYKKQTYKGPNEVSGIESPCSASMSVFRFPFSSPSVPWQCLCSQVTTNHPYWRHSFSCYNPVMFRCWEILIRDKNYGRHSP